MKFSCKTKDILRTVGVVSRAISSQQAMPILGNILFQVEGKRCTLSATNLEFSIISHLEAEVENEGSITIPAKAIANFAQYSTGDTVLFESAEDTQLKCTSNKTKTIIAGEAASEYPTIAPIQKEASFSIQGDQLLQALHHVTFASAKTTTRPVLSGVYTKASKNELLFVATDSYRLSEYRVPLEGSEGNIECIVPTRVLIEVMHVLGGGKKEKGDDDNKPSPEKISITLSAQQIEVISGDTTILSRLIDGSFPDYEQILPQSASTTVTIPLNEFLTNVKRMHYFAKESNNNLTFTISDKEVQVQTQPTQFGRDESTMESTVKGDGNKIALSSAYLLDFLTHVSGDEVQMEITDKMHPAVFRLSALPSFLHLIMPLRLNEE